MPELLAGEYVAEMNLDERYGNGQQRVAQGDAGMGKSAGIDDHEGDPVALGGVNPGDQLMLGIALERQQLMALRPGERAELLLDIPQCGGAVNRRFARSQQIEVGSVEQQDSRHLEASPALSREKRSAIITRN